MKSLHTSNQGSEKMDKSTDSKGLTGEEDLRGT